MKLQWQVILRPIVAVAHFIIFAAMQIDDAEGLRHRLRNGDKSLLDSFVQEVRRHSPFFPFIGGRLKQSLEWRGHRFATGTWFLLDLYGTNHDSRLWAQLDAFTPERFIERKPSPFDVIPQGGGEYLSSHRCPGEWITIELIKAAVRILTEEMWYEIPDQDLSVELSRIPAVPRSGYVIANLRRPQTSFPQSRKVRP